MNGRRKKQNQEKRQRLEHSSCGRRQGKADLSQVSLSCRRKFELFGKTLEPEDHGSASKGGTNGCLKDTSGGLKGPSDRHFNTHQLDSLEIHLSQKED